MSATSGSREQKHSPQCHVHEVDYAIDLTALHRSDPERYPHLLQSTAHGRYDILFAFPGDSLELDAEGNVAAPEFINSSDEDFLTALDDWWQQEVTVQSGSNLPFTGGWFVYLGYELAGQVEPCLQLPQPVGDLPVAIATRFRTAVVRDNEQQQSFIVAEQSHTALVENIRADIAALSGAFPAETAIVATVSEDDPKDYLDAIERIHSYIREGDVFQVNLSRCWKIMLEEPVSAVTLFRNLGKHNPSPFAGLAAWEGVSIISSSPERLVRVHDGFAETRPIAGTRPRSNVSTSDKAYSEELLAHPKERAEHIMLIDLERNDLGRLCVPGSIEVNELMVLESYAHVHHIVSNVRGRLRDNISPGEVLRAVFPGGTITGCPKVRCMQIIAELEQVPRGAYTGSMGYINRDGSMDLNILIRTMVCQGKQLELRAGAGIVADSNAQAELEETRVKARGLLHALGLDDA
ncbi:MAG TPA: aminodeoxychorismate synthase component I [Gammaproteobacteria bacterium]|nr:aminodeoxychorismate synthase component I [Gammaproteobacteria bacterium]